MGSVAGSTESNFCLRQPRSARAYQPDISSVKFGFPISGSQEPGMSAAWAAALMAMTPAAAMTNALHARMAIASLSPCA